jgi:hypothetical protein
MVSSSDAAGMLSLIAGSDGSLVFNDSRMAIQGYGCGGEVLIHLPVDAAFASALQQAASENGSGSNQSGSGAFTAALLLAAGMLGVGKTRQQ